MPGLRVSFRGGIAWAVGSVNGQRVRRSLKTRDPKRAEELRAAIEARLWKRSVYGDEAIRTFEEAALSYQKAEGESRFLAPLIRHFRGRTIASIKPEEIRQAARALYSRCKPSTQNRNAITPARAVINHAAGLGWCPTIKVKSFPTEKARRQSANRAWLDTFLDQADDDDLPHLAAAVLFMWQTGARVSEAARVLPEHMNLRQRIILLASTKTGEWEPCHITRELVIRLANLTLTDGEPVFGYASRYGIYLRMRAVCRRAGLPWRSPHEAGRHSYATNALADGATIKEAMEGGRWKTARIMLETYAHADQGGRKIADRFDTKRAQAKRRKAQAVGKKR